MSRWTARSLSSAAIVANVVDGEDDVVVDDETDDVIESIVTGPRGRGRQKVIIGSDTGGEQRNRSQISVLVLVVLTPLVGGGSAEGVCWTSRSKAVAT
jgi:hypothetical protein